MIRIYDKILQLQKEPKKFYDSILHTTFEYKYMKRIYYNSPTTIKYI